MPLARLRLLCAVIIVIGYAAMQRFWLPADGFLTGDSGTKYLQSRAVVMHGPLTPWVEGPSLEIDTARVWQEPFLLRRGDHLVGEFPWLFPTVTAPFLWLLGLHGLFVVPAVAAAGVFLAASALGRRLAQPAGGMWSGGCALLATPVLVYGAELWEHAPAVACSTAGAALLVKTEPIDRRDGLVASLCFALAFAFRPEALAVAPAFLLARAAVIGPGTLRRDVLVLLPGAMAAAITIAVMNVVIDGSLIPYHVSSNVAAGLSSLVLRGQAIGSMLLPRAGQAWFVAGAIAIGVAAFLPVSASRTWIVRAAVALMLIAGVGVPLWKTWAGGVPWLETSDMLSLASTWPLLPALGLYASQRLPRGPEGVLVLGTCFTFLLVLAAVPHAGGAQWSARFLLPGMPLGAVLAVELARRHHTRLLSAAAIAMSIGLQIYGLTLLHHFKGINSKIAHVTQVLTKPGDVIVSDLFWYPQVTATLYPTRRFLFARQRSDIEAIASRVADAGFDTFWIVTVTPVTGYEPPASLPSGKDRPFVKNVVRDPYVGSLTFHRFVK